MRLNLPLNRLITIHWKTAGVPLEAMVGATGLFLDIVSKSLARRGTPTSWVYVHENGQEEGWHCHILLHLPMELVPHLTSKQCGWITRISGRPYSKGAIRSRIVGGRLGVERTNPELYQCNLQQCVEYVVKQTEPATARQYGLTRVAPPSRVIGKRAGNSENIGISARHRHFGG